MRSAFLVLCALALSACQAAPVASVASAPPTPREVHYRVRFEEPGVLHVTVDVQGGGCETLVLEPGGIEFVTDVSVTDAAGQAAPLSVTERGITSQACGGVCSIRYRMDLLRAASYWKNPEYAGLFGGVLFAPPTSWLLHPPRADHGRFQLEVEGASHLFGLAHEQNRYRAELADLPRAPYGAFGELRRRTVRVGTSVIELGIAGPVPAFGDEVVERWVHEAALDVSGYLGSFPSQRTAVFVLVGEGEGIGHATALGNGGASILARLGKDTSEADLANDWVMTHEMVHLGLVGMHRRYDWMAEGLATYVEPLARARRSRMAPERVWREFYLGMHRGQPEPGDGGLDGTTSWGRTYWGGAQFWLLVDLAIREKTADKFTLANCLSAAVREGGTIATRWSVERFLKSCDGALGAEIVKPIYEEHANQPVTVDLSGLFLSLGVTVRRTETRFDDQAPRASARAALTGLVL